LTSTPPKELLAERGFRIPRGYLATTTAEAVDACRRIGGAVVLKPLLLTGKRGKAGLIRFAESNDDARREAEELFAHLDVEKLRIEELVAIDLESYSPNSTINRRRAAPKRSPFRPLPGPSSPTASRESRRSLRST